MKKSRISARRTIDSSQFKPTELMKEREKDPREGRSNRDLKEAKSPR